MDRKLKPIKGWIWLNLIFGTILIPLAFMRYLEGNWFWFWWDAAFAILNLWVVWRDIRPDRNDTRSL